MLSCGFASRVGLGAAGARGRESIMLAGCGLQSDVSMNNALAEASQLQHRSPPVKRTHSSSISARSRSSGSRQQQQAAVLSWHAASAAAVKVKED
jgi:hypothetical protein